MFDFFTNKAQRQLADCYRKQAMCTSNVCSCLNKKVIDFTKPIVGLRTGAPAKVVCTCQGGETVISFVLPGETKTLYATVDKFGVRTYDGQPMVKNKEPLYKGENVSVEIWRSPAGRFHTRVASQENKPFTDGHKLVGHKEIYVIYEV